jgi:hypothetical protein
LRTRYEKTPELSDDGFHASATVYAVTLAARRLVGAVGGLLSLTFAASDTSGAVSAPGSGGIGSRHASESRATVLMIAGVEFAIGRIGRSCIYRD